MRSDANHVFAVPLQSSPQEFDPEAKPPHASRNDSVNVHAMEKTEFDAEKIWVCATRAMGTLIHAIRFRLTPYDVMYVRNAWQRRHTSMGGWSGKAVQCAITDDVNVPNVCHVCSYSQC